MNSKGKEVGELDEKPAVAGHNLKLTVDIDLQIAAEEAMGDKNGADGGHGSAHRRNPGHGQPADLRSQRFCGANFAR